MLDITRTILFGIQQLAILVTVVLFTAAATHAIFLDSQLITIYMYMIMGLVAFIIAFIIYDHVKSDDFITTIQLLTDYGFGEDATLDEVMEQLEAYCVKNGMDIENVD